MWVLLVCASQALSMFEAVERSGGREARESESGEEEEAEDGR